MFEIYTFFENTTEICNFFENRTEIYTFFENRFEIYTCILFENRTEILSMVDGLTISTNVHDWQRLQEQWCRVSPWGFRTFHFWHDMRKQTDIIHLWEGNVWGFRIVVRKAASPAWRVAGKRNQQSWAQASRCSRPRRWQRSQGTPNSPPESQTGLGQESCPWIETMQKDLLK